MTGLFPEITPYRTDTLAVSNRHSMHYEEVGNPEGRPALFLHGGPGVGILPGYRRFFDPDAYRIFLPDQRGAGRSTPHGELEDNTTWHLVEDLEQLRRKLGVDDWIVMGGSWGSTLALSYAITHPGSVAGLILRGVFLARSWESTWLYEGGGAAKVFPDEWELFYEPVRNDTAPTVVSAYHARLTSADEATRLAAAKSWSRWETAMATLVPDEATIAQTTADDAALAKARIESAYAHHGFFMPSENHLLDQAHVIADIPCHIVQGRHDVICPTVSAWNLHHALPKSKLEIVPDGSHSPMDPGMATALVRASESFKALKSSDQPSR